MSGPPSHTAPLSDKELIAAVAAGDREAFGAVVDRYDRRVFAICFRYFGDQAEAEDAAQETFVTLLRRAETFRGGAAFSTWLYRITMNTCHDLGRRRARRPSTVPLGGASGDTGDGDAPANEPADSTPGVEQLVGMRELGDELTGALRHLAPEQAEAVVLHDGYGVPYEEIAARCGVAVGTVKSRIHRAHARLADALGSPRRARTEPSATTTPPTHGEP